MTKRNMAKAFMIMFATAALFMSFSMCNGEENDEVIYVGGKVLCQDCTQDWDAWVHGSKPIKGSVVSVTCMDQRNRVMDYESDECDETGAYEIKINKHKHGKELDPSRCYVRLASSPDPVCKIATDFSGGKTGVKLKIANVVYRDMVKYVQDPLYYTNPMCADPYTSNNQYSDDNQTEY